MKWVRLVSFLVIVCIFTPIIERTVNAQQFRSPGYQIESGSLILQPELDQNSANYDVPASFGPDVQKKFEKLGYVLIGNIDPASSEKPYIRLNVDKSQLVFDTAEVRGESVQQSTINLFGSGATNFIVSLRQEEQFKNSFGAAISPTHCDKESSKCTPVLAQTWIKAFGFGYRANGTNMRDFNNPNAYRPLFIGGLTGKSAVIFEEEIGKTGKELDLRFKLRPQTQTQTGIYKGTIIITASTAY